MPVRNTDSHRRLSVSCVLYLFSQQSARVQPNFVIAQSLLARRAQPLGNPAGCRSYQEGMTANALRPDLMSSDERLDEVAEILAAGLMRLMSRQSSPLSADLGESSLDCPADQS